MLNASKNGKRLKKLDHKT